MSKLKLKIRKKLGRRFARIVGRQQNNIILGSAWLSAALPRTALTLKVGMCPDDQGKCPDYIKTEGLTEPIYRVPKTRVLEKLIK